MTRLDVLWIDQIIYQSRHISIVLDYAALFEHVTGRRDGCLLLLADYGVGKVGSFQHACGHCIVKLGIAYQDGLELGRVLNRPQIVPFHKRR
jgi:hypothetical protein